MMGLGWPEMVILLIVLAIGIIPLVWAIVTVIEIARSDPRAWQAAGQSQIAALLLVVLLPLVGTLIYWFGMRPQLTRAGQ